MPASKPSKSKGKTTAAKKKPTSSKPSASTAKKQKAKPAKKAQAAEPAAPVQSDGHGHGYDTVEAGAQHHQGRLLEDHSSYGAENRIDPSWLTGEEDGNFHGTRGHIMGSSGAYQ
eukprot:RCo005291